MVVNAVASIERLLPYPGEIHVRMGQRVEPEDVIGRAFVPGTPHIINVARALSISPRDVPHAMMREVGNKVTQGDVLARSSRLGGRSYIAPVSGEIVAVDAETGYVTISPDPEEQPVYAAARGIVMEVLSNRGVRIETPAAQVFGVFGVGEERAGVLRLLVTDASEVITPEQINAKSAYAIVIGGSGITAAALRRAVEEQVRGVIVGGIDERELRAFLGVDSYQCWRSGLGDWHFPVQNSGQPAGLTLVVTEGLGARPMSAPLFDMLAEHDRLEALIEGRTVLYRGLARPRVVIPLSARAAKTQLEPPRPELRPGARVRLLTYAELGQVGVVRAVWAAPRVMNAQIRAPAVDVEFEDSRIATFPRSAVEVLA